MWLSDAQAKSIVEHAQAEYPREACGVIAGTSERAAEIIPIPNTADDPLRAYVMEPRALVAAFARLEQRHLELIGFYHSHPHSDPIPSPSDVQLATYPGIPYLIVGLKDGSARLAAWNLLPGKVEAVLVHVGSEPPRGFTQRQLSPVEKIVILVSAVIALLLVIVVSLSLLPPAPPIPH